MKRTKLNKRVVVDENGQAQVRKDHVHQIDMCKVHDDYLNHLQAEYAEKTMLLETEARKPFCCYLADELSKIDRNRFEAMMLELNSKKES